MADLAFVLIRQPAAPHSGPVIAAARRYGIELTATSDKHPAVHVGFSMAGAASLDVLLLPFPHPGIGEVPFGPTSPQPEDLPAARARLIISAEGLAGDDRSRDTTMAKVTAAVIDGAGPGQAVGVMLGHGTVFHRADVFAEAARMAAERSGPLPVEVAVDVTAARESPTRMSFLTHGLDRYGREEFYVTCPIEGKGALSLVFAMARWMLADPGKHLGTGETIGRTPEEKLVVQRVPHPSGERPDVIRLDLL